MLKTSTGDHNNVKDYGDDSIVCVYVCTYISNTKNTQTRNKNIQKWKNMDCLCKNLRIWSHDEDVFTAYTAPKGV